jgi:hypothetical protein
MVKKKRTKRICTPTDDYVDPDSQIPTSSYVTEALESFYSAEFLRHIPKYSDVVSLSSFEDTFVQHVDKHKPLQLWKYGKEFAV